MPSKDMLPNSYQLKLQLVLTAQTSQLLLPPDMHSVVTASQLLCQACCYQTHRSSWPGYSSSQKSASTCALLYIAAFCCTPDCHGIMSQLITGNYVIKFERNSFRVQLSARGIATCFASAQPKAQVAAQTGYYKRKLACFYRQHCPLEACLPMALACCCAANLPSADSRFPRSTHSQGQSSAASATDDICRTGPTYTRVRWFTRPTCSQIELSSHTNCSAKQGLVLDTDF